VLKRCCREESKYFTENDSNKEILTERRRSSPSR